MKKVYSKPEIAFDSFTLSTNIAGDCGLPTNTQSEGNCNYPMGGGVVVFLDGIAGCKYKPQGGSDEYNGICYYTPIPEGELFNS